MVEHAYACKQVGNHLKSGGFNQSLENKNRWQGNVLDLKDVQLECYGLLIDGLFGTSLKRPLQGNYLEIIKIISNSILPIVSIDMPSGINSDTGEVMASAVFAKTTITFGYRKPGQLLLPGYTCTGELVIKNIGFAEPDLLEAPSLTLNHPALWLNDICLPQNTDNKYTRGHTLIIGGAEMTGASRLAAAACRRVGCGMVTIACSPTVKAIYALSSPGLIIKTFENNSELGKIISDKKVNAILVGPGLESNAETYELVKFILAKKMPCVLDAGAITCLETQPLPTEVGRLGYS